MEIPRWRLPPQTLELLNAAAFAATLLGAGLVAIVEPPAEVAVGVGFVFFLFYVQVARSKREREYEFRENSAELAEFFRTWYSRPGRHTVFCDDLDWMAGAQNASISAALAERRSSATVCVRKSSGEVFDRLRAAGVEMREIDVRSQMRAKLSIYESDDQREMIVRIKAREDDKIRFKRSRDRFTIGLADDLVRIGTGAAQDGVA